MDGKHADMGTFVIRVQQCRNNTLQGGITWADEDKTQNFRSTWEMLKLIESAVETENGMRITDCSWGEQTE